jgi:hypothetical protein
MAAMVAMQTEEKIVIVLLFMALGSLSVAFWAFSPSEATANSETRLEKVGVLSEEGRVLQIKPTNSGGNLLLSLDSTSMPIFIPSSAGAHEVGSKVHIGDLVRVSGSVSVFQGKKELKISRAEDVQLI